MHGVLVCVGAVVPARKRDLEAINKLVPEKLHLCGHTKRPRVLASAPPCRHPEIGVTRTWAERCPSLESGAISTIGLYCWCSDNEEGPEMQIYAFTLSLVCCIVPVLGNVEKTIFLAPQAINIPKQHPSLDVLRLDTLTPINSTLRRRLPATFPSLESPRGTESWFLLEGLHQNQRYEVRICWAATV